MGYKKPRPSKHKVRSKRGLSGIGLFAEDEIKRSDFIIEYYGPIVSDDEADRVGGKYLFRLENERTILGNQKKNLARYINHSCKPNAYAEMDGDRIFIYAKRKIEPGEEITYHYGKEYWEDFIGKNCQCSECRSKKSTK